MHKSILFVSPSAYPLGGLATWLDYIVPGLEQRGWNVVVGLTAGRHHNVKAYLKEHPFEKIAIIKNRTGSMEGRVRSIYSTLATIKPDMVLSVNIPDVFFAVDRYRKKMKKEIRCVMTVHGIQPDLYEDIKQFGRILDAVICTNKLACGLAEDVGEYDPARIYYSPYGVVIPQYQKRSSQNRRLTIAFAGRFERFQKRIDDIPEILELLDRKKIKYKFLFAGGGPDELHLKGQLSEQMKDNTVLFLGTLSENEIITEVYNRADIFLLPSLWETGPIVIWEAMAHSAAVVTSAYIGSRLEGKLRHEDNCLMFPIGDSAKAADCIERLIISEFRESITLRAHNFVNNCYSRKISVECWDRCLNEIFLPPPIKPSVNKVQVKLSGRLDRLLGVSIAEHVRELLGREYMHTGPGEWPHSYGAKQMDDRVFWDRAQAIDISQRVSDYPHN
jgi:glycosyltransferase involved in cell wall biosynthesis